jgi:hypothetical protein
MNRRDHDSIKTDKVDFLQVIQKQLRLAFALHIASLFFVESLPSGRVCTNADSTVPEKRLPKAMLEIRSI